MASLCHPWFTTTNLSYRFPIFETSATALRGTTGIDFGLASMLGWCLTFRDMTDSLVVSGHPKHGWNLAETPSRIRFLTLWAVTRLGCDYRYSKVVRDSPLICSWSKHINRKHMESTIWSSPKVLDWPQISTSPFAFLGQFLGPRAVAAESACRGNWWFSQSRSTCGDWINVDPDLICSDWENHQWLSINLQLVTFYRIFDL